MLKKDCFFEKMSQKVLKFKGKSIRDHEKAQNFRLRRSIMKKTLINLFIYEENNIDSEYLVAADLPLALGSPQLASSPGITRKHSKQAQNRPNPLSLSSLLCPS